MRSFTTIFLLASVMIGVSYGFIINPPNDSTGHLVENIKTVAKDLKESLAHKRKAVIDTASTIAKAKLDVLRNIKKTKGRIVNNIFKTNLAKLHDIRTAKQKFLRTIFDNLHTSFNKHGHDIELESSQPFYIAKLQELQHNIVKHPLLQFLSQPLFKFPKFPRKEDSSKSQIKINGVDYVFVPASNPGYNVQPYNQPEDAQDGHYTYANVQPHTEPVKSLSREEEPPMLYGSLTTGYNPASTYASTNLCFAKYSFFNC